MSRTMPRSADTIVSWIASCLFVSSTVLSTAVQAQKLDVVAELRERPGNPAITPDGRILFSQQPLDSPELKVVELRPDGTLVPFPNLEWARDRFAAVIAIKALANGTVWILDMGAEGRGAKLVAWNTRTDKLEREVLIPVSVQRPNSFLQDFAVDERRGIITIADMTAGNLTGESHPAFVVVDLKTGRARRVLEDHASFRPDDQAVVVDSRALATRRSDGREEQIRFGLNGIAIDQAGEWIYFAAVSSRTVWRLPTPMVADPSLSEAALARGIERYADKPPSDGIAIDGTGRLLITDVENAAIGVAAPGGYATLLKDPRLSWPDGIAFGPEGTLYVTSNQLHRHPSLNRGTDAGQPPYYLFRVAPQASTGQVSGHAFNIASEAARLPAPGTTAIVERQLIVKPDAGIRMFRVDRPLPRHMHRLSDEYLYVVSGSATIIVGDDPARTIKAGDLIYYGRGVWHAVPEILQAPFVVMAFETPARAQTDVVFASPE